MAYRALYRTYRPAVFADVIGQKHVTVTLQNQIATGHVAHAYLFCGTRGTGKTSTAKIFARAVNCLAPINGEPCGTCAACRHMLEGSSPDITEIDAASNNGVDNVRGLIEQVRFSTMELGTRVLIIDEVHMLSGSAFNALLKTLEEPPEHTLFILATTEPQKLPATIISRCQRFDFHRISIPDIILNLKNVLAKAGASIDEDGLQLIARSADGGMRDALSLADQCLAFCGDTVTSKDVHDVLGSMDQGFLFDFSAAVLAGDTAKALQMMDGIVRGGRDLSVFTQDLASHMRALMLAGTCGRCEDLLDCTKESMDRYIAQAKTTSAARLLSAMQALLHVQGEMRYLTYPRALLEATIVKICRPEDSRNLLALESRIDALEREVAALKAAPPQVSVAASSPTDVAVPSAAPVQTASAAPVKAAAPAAPKASAIPASFAAKLAEASAKMQEDEPSSPAPKGPALPKAPFDEMSPDAFFNALLAEIKRANPLIHRFAARGCADKLEGQVLTIRFADSDSVAYNSMAAPINRKKLDELADKLWPGAKIVLRKGSVDPVSEEELKSIQDVMGPNLKVEE